RGHVVVRDLGRTGNAHAIADRHQPEEFAVVDHRDVRGAIPAGALEGDRDAFHRIYGRADAVPGEQRSGEAAHGDDDRIGGDPSLVGHDGLDATVAGLDRSDGLAEPALYAAFRTSRRQPWRELVGIADLVAGE